VAGIKQVCPQLLVWTDVCLCSARIMATASCAANGMIDNDSSIATLAKVALNHARAGGCGRAERHDGWRVAAIRQLLDANGFADTPSCLCGQVCVGLLWAVREAADSARRSGSALLPDGSANVREALREVLEDVDEGADMVMVKPAGPYLDVIRRVREAVNIPVVATGVGEYSLLKAPRARLDR